MMKDDVLLISQALKAFTDIANILTSTGKRNPTESQTQSPLFTGCG
jgi:hypothetical protein